MSQPTGLEAFAAPTVEEPSPRKKKAIGEKVALTVRLTRPQWLRLRAFAANEGTDMQQIAIDGISNIFEAKGLAKL
jgi:hypothetical protein